MCEWTRPLHCFQPTHRSKHAPTPTLLHLLPEPPLHQCFTSFHLLPHQHFTSFPSLSLNCSLSPGFDQQSSQQQTEELLQDSGQQYSVLLCKYKYCSTRCIIVCSDSGNKCSTVCTGLQYCVMAAAQEGNQTAPGTAGAARGLHQSSCCCQQEALCSNATTTQH